MRKIFIISSALLIASCSSVADKSDSTNFPIDHQDARKVKAGTITGDDGITLFGGKQKDDDKPGNGIGVNSFLWRASLDTISFMPITQADPFGGVIITDWYEDPSARGERFKVNITILDNRLRADGIRVALFKQKADDKNIWHDETVSKESEREIEDTILTRARELRVKQTGK